MFFRFAAALMVAVAVSMLSVALEKQTLQLRRSVSRQYYQTDLLLDMHAQLRLQIQKLTSPSLVTDQSSGRFGPDMSQAYGAAVSLHPSTSARDQSQAGEPQQPGQSAVLPLLRWQRPVNPIELQ